MVIWLLGNVFRLTEENWRDFWHHFWVLPGEIGKERLTSWDLGVLGTFRGLIWMPFQVLLPDLNFQFRQLMVFPLYMYLAERLWKHFKNMQPMPEYPLKHTILGISLLACNTFFIKTTQNQVENGLNFTCIAIGLGLLFWKEWIQNGPLGRVWPSAATRLWYFLLIFVSGTAVLAGIRFHQEVNITRRVLDFQDAERTNSLSPPAYNLNGLEFQAPYEPGTRNPVALVEWLTAHHKNVVYFGDMRFLLAIAGKEDLLPSVWVHPGLTFPVPGTSGFEAFDLEFLKNIEGKSVRYIIFENDNHRSYLGSPWELLSHTAAFIEERKVFSQNIGGFEVWTLKEESQ